MPGLTITDPFGGAASTQIPAQAPVQVAVTVGSGDVLFLGSQWNGSANVVAAQIYHPGTGVVSTVSGYRGSAAPWAGVTLADGRALIVGVAAQQVTTVVGGSQAESQLFNPSDGSWSVAAPMPDPCWPDVVVRLRDGRVLVIGDRTPWADADVAHLFAAEIYNPTSDRWQALGPPSPALSWGSGGSMTYSEVVLNNGSVLFTGRGRSVGEARAAELFNPATDAWLPAAPMLRPREGDTAVVMRNGEVLVTGGDLGYQPSAEIYNPAADSWRLVARPLEWRGPDAAITLLADGRVLVAGGTGQEPPACSGCAELPPPTLATSEIFGP
jgi:hypothetical protein